MTNSLPAPHGSCLASGQTVIPYLDEPIITVICPECGADVPLDRLTQLDKDLFSIATHRPGQQSPRRRGKGTQLMLGF